MVIDADTRAVLSRRRLIQTLAACSVSSVAWGQGASSSRGRYLVAAWEHQAGYRLGVVLLTRDSWSVVRTLDLPTRTHGLFYESDGAVLAAARRPGEWLLRWHWRTGDTQWSWVDDDRRLNGHVISSEDGQTLLCTETDQGSGRGLLGIRDGTTLQKIQELETHGLDPHQLMILPKPLGRCPAGSLLVANGGVRTFVETGRVKSSGVPLDSSLVALSPKDGSLLGQWRLPDPFLSIRHLAWDPVSDRLGIALQAEHPDPSVKEAAPVLAIWDGTRLYSASEQPSLQGYGGDITALPGSGFAVSCPKANLISLFDAEGTCTSVIQQSGVCALTGHEDLWFAAGKAELVMVGQEGAWRPTRLLSPSFQWDNHWLAL